MRSGAEQTVEHPLMACPVCGVDVVAQVVVAVEAKATSVALAERSVAVKADAKMLRFHVTHSCPGRADVASADDLTPADLGEVEQQ